MELLCSVPASVWAAIAASLLTLTGVFFSNRQHSKQQMRQLAHEKEQNGIDREFQLRRTVYLEAADEVTHAFQHLSDIAHVDIAEKNVSEPLSSFFASVNKACLVASNETVEVLNTFVTEYSLVFFELLAKLTPIQDARIQRDIENSAYAKYQAEVTRLLSAITQFNEEARSDPTVWSTLSGNLQFNMDNSAEASRASSEAWDKLNTLTSRYAIELLPVLRRLGKLAIPVYVAIRREIGLDSDIAVFEKSFEDRYSAIANQLEKLIDSVNKDAK